MVEQPVFLGVDGGNSKTEALAVDGAGHFLGTSQSLGSNYQGIGLSAALDHIQQAATQALGGLRAHAAAFCLAGADMPSDFAHLEPALRGLNLADEMALYNDVIAVFRAGSDRPYGMAVVCGAGFNAGGINRDGQEFRLPSLGEVTGDRGGGGHLGVEALGSAFRAWDGRGPETCLQEMVLKVFNVPDIPALAERLVQKQIPYSQIIHLTPLVFSAAAAGDRVARGMIREQGREVGITILAILRRLDLLDTPCQTVLGGSVFYGEGSLLMNTIHKTIRPSAPLVEVKRLDTRPVVGAVLLAADRAKITDHEIFAANLRATLPETLRLKSDE
jgi:N-acetylglucosamine kinase-like BadF-type ATPase